MAQPWKCFFVVSLPYSIGQHQSHGCIRMRNHDVLELYNLVPLGTKLTIYGHVLGESDQMYKRNWGYWSNT
ncbi:hypothetical protein DXC69_08235 [Paenibacillus polymyxa]|nr:L,D-transpeptidase [Paenibacillus polymyxa]RGL37646.1 hypothetical protein DXC69_08235 [Paenibacillus polymyxa]